MNRSLG